MKVAHFGWWGNILFPIPQGLFLSEGGGGGGGGVGGGGGGGGGVGGGVGGGGENRICAKWTIFIPPGANFKEIPNPVVSCLTCPS